MPAAVVGHGDDDFGAELHGMQSDGAVRRLSGRGALVGGLDAVIDGVADQVQQRIGELVQHAAVHFGVQAACFPPHLFALGAGQVTHRPVKLVADGAIPAPSASGSLGPAGRSATVTVR